MNRGTMDTSQAAYDKMIDALEARIARLEAIRWSLETRIARLEAFILRDQEDYSPSLSFPVAVDLMLEDKSLKSVVRSTIEDALFNMEVEQ